MNTPENDAGSTIAVAERGGSKFLSIHVERSVKIYPVQENELEAFTSLNITATTAFSLSASFLFFGAGTLVNHLLVDAPQAGALGLLLVIEIGCAVLAAGFAAGGVWAVCRRKAMWQRIVQETRS
jgi:hypothetical protein